MSGKLTKEEQEIINYIEESNAPSIPNLKNEMLRYESVAKDQVSKKKAISLRLLESDLEDIKAKAISIGMPYQTLISSIIHQYNQGKLKSV